MPHALFTTEIRVMLAENDTEGLRAACESVHPATIAEAIDEFTGEEIWQVIASSDVRTQASIFEYLPLGEQITVIESNKEAVAKLIEKMSHDDRVDLIRRLPEQVKESLLRYVDVADRRDIASLFAYEQNTVGAIMTTDYAWLLPTLTAAEAVDQLRQQAPDRETIYYVYVLDEAKRRPDGQVLPRKLLGALSLRDLILAPRNSMVRELMEEEIVSLNFQDYRESATAVFARYDFLAVPVVDDNGGMLGIVTHDDVLDVVQEEATEDLRRQAGVGKIEGNYLDASFWQVWRSRVKWLAVLFVAQMFTINVMAQYDDHLKAIAVLSVFVPLCLSVGGNAGSQAATLVIRALALDQIQTRDWLRVLSRELIMGIALAGTLGLLGLARTYFLTPGHLVDEQSILLKLTYAISITVIGTCLWGTLIGAMLPLFFHHIKVDPALISSPAIATISDVSGIFIYFTVCKVFFF